MEKRIILGLSTLFLAACSTGSYVSDVTVATHQEDYPTATMQKPVVSQDGSTNGVTETTNHMAETDIQAQPSNDTPAVAQTKSTSAVVIMPPTAKDVAHKPHRFGYTLQVVAVGSQNKVNGFVSKLPQTGHPVWENYKVLNGTKWYTVLYGDFATQAEAKAAIQTLPKDFIQLKPFVKSIDAIKNSEYPTLNKLN
ncbi:SPOR domain-containing protein [Vibrio sp. PP-XX7]